MARILDTIFEDPQVAPQPRQAGSPSGVKHLDTEFDQATLIAKAAEKYKIDPLMLQALVRVESGGNAKAQGPEVTRKGAYNPATGEYDVVRERAGGLFQIMPRTALGLGITDVFDPAQNIDGGARYLRQLLDHPSAKGDMSTALMFYHGGTNPNNWGEKSLAYPGKVLAAYRQLGGIQNDPDVPKIGPVLNTLNGVLPGNLLAQTALGSGPDLSQGLSRPDANRPVGAKIGDWWDSVSPKLANWDKGVATYKKQNPLMGIATDVIGSLPGALALGVGIPRAFRAIGAAVPQLASTMGFAGGGGGLGLASGEGANLATQFASKGALGAATGAVQGAAWPQLDPQTDWQTRAASGAAVGGAFGAVLPALGAGAGRALFGSKIDQETARLAQAFRTGGPTRDVLTLPDNLARQAEAAGLNLRLPGSAREPFSLRPNVDQINKLSLNPDEFSRQVLSRVGEGYPTTVDRGQLVNARRTIGHQFDESTRDLSVALDDRFQEQWRALRNSVSRDAGLARKLGRLEDVQDISRRLAYLSSMEDGVMSGVEYQSLTRKGGAVTKLAGDTNPKIAEYGQQLRSILDGALDRGAQENIQVALTRGDLPGAQKAVADYAMLQQARQQWRSLKATEGALDPVTLKVDPAKLHAGAKDVGGDLETIARAGIAFDPTKQAARSSMWLPYAGVAAGTQLVTGDPYTTGQAALGLAALLKGGRAARQIAQRFPGATSGLIDRSLRHGPGPAQEAMRLFGQSAVPAISGRNPLLERGQE